MMENLVATNPADRTPLQPRTSSTRRAGAPKDPGPVEFLYPVTPLVVA